MDRSERERGGSEGKGGRSRGGSDESVECHDAVFDTVRDEVEKKEEGCRGGVLYIPVGLSY